MLQTALGSPHRQRNHPDLQRWHALQLWLQTGSKRVVIPFAAALMDLIPPRALRLRLRRGGSALLGLIAAHALLHQTTRTKDKAERIVATVTDYAATRPLIADVIAAGTEAIVRPIVRETVEAVAALIAEGVQEVGLRMLAVRLELDPAPTYRRVEEAIAQGFLRNLEPRRKQRRRMRLVLDEPLPDAVELLPSVSTLQAALLRYGVPPTRKPLSPLSVEGRGRWRATRRNQRNSAIDYCPVVNDAVKRRFRAHDAGRGATRPLTSGTAYA